MRTYLSRWATGLLVVLAASTASAAVTVEEIIRLHTAGLSDQSLLLVISASDTPDTLSTLQLTQMLEAQVPDTVVAALVEKADAVMEDWQPVDLEEQMKGHNVYTEAEVRYVYPSWDGWYGYGGWGWCGTPWYSYYPWYGHCAYPYSGLYVGYGYGAGWSFGINFGWGYGGYSCYNPYYYYGGGGYCGFYDPYSGYDPYYGGYCPAPAPYYSYRNVDRVDYHSGPPDRQPGRTAPGTPYGRDFNSDTRTTLSRLEGRKLTTVDRTGSTKQGKSVRDAVSTPATRSVDDLTRVTAPGTKKTTLTSADRGDGRYVIKGDDKKLRESSGSTGRTLETVGSKKDRTTSSKANLESGSTMKGKVDRGLQRDVEQRSTDLAGRVTEHTRKLASTATGAESVGDKVNRYVKMKEAQRAPGTRGNRSTASKTSIASAPRDAGSAPSRGSSSTSVQRQGAQKSPDSKAAPSTQKSAPKSFSGGGQRQRSGGSFGSPSRSGGSGGGSRGGFTSRGGGGGGSRGGRR